MNFFCNLLLFLFISFSMSGSFAKEFNKNNAFVKAKHVEYDANTETITASGGVLIQVDEYILEASTVHYNISKDIVFAEGNIKITDEFGKVIFGQKAVFKDKFKHGIIKEFAARMGNNSIVVSRVAKKLNKDQFYLEESVFTPCDTHCGKNPIWQITAAKTNIDYQKQEITYRHSFFEVYGIPIIYIPYFSHPLPKAEGRSGILLPRIKQNSFLVPFYFRAKPNLDFTIAPRFAKDYTIFETEFRHKVKNGKYIILANYGNPVDKKLNNNKQNTSPALRYHILAKGNFAENQINFGFNINRASDKAYLTNYNNIFDSYLTSEIYVNTIDGRDYFSLQSFYFQDFRSANHKLKTPFIFPYIQTHNVFELNEDESLLLNVRTNTVAYRRLEELQMARESIELELMNNLISNNGHIITYSASNRSDFYWVDSFDNPNKLNQKTLYRNIPEISACWRYPLVKSITSKSYLELEPTIMSTIGRKFEKRFNKFGIIDSNKTELSENNLFYRNRFTGIDFHDYGSRISYGLNSALMSEYLYVNGFLGQLLHKNNITERGNSEYVGNIGVSIQNNFELFYRFRKDQKLKNILDEAGASITTENFYVTSSFAKLHNVSKYFSDPEMVLGADSISQLNLQINYQLIKNLWLGYSTNLDISNQKTKTLVRTIQMTYLFDCVSINGTIRDNFLEDHLRGVKNTRSYTFSVGLKVINM